MNFTRRLALALGLAGAIAAGAGPDQVGPARRLPGHQLPHRKPGAVRQRRRQGHRRQAQDHRACQRVAVQGARDQARGAGRPGADRRDPAGELPATNGRSSAPTACPSWPTATTRRSSCTRRRSRCSRRSSAEQGMMLLYAVAWPPQGIYAKKPINSAADLKGVKWRAYSPQHRAHCRAGRRAAGHGAGRRAVARRWPPAWSRPTCPRAPPATTPRPTST